MKPEIRKFDSTSHTQEFEKDMRHRRDNIEAYDTFFVAGASNPGDKLKSTEISKESCLQLNF